MADIRITAGPCEFLARWEREKSPTSFASKLGQLAGNHFLTITDGLEGLRPLGKMTLWKGAQNILFDHG